jgi:hypothetical protein
MQISGSIYELQELFEKLERSKFSGKLSLTFESGKVSSAELKHYLPFSELKKPLPVIEEEFSLKG